MRARSHFGRWAAVAGLLAISAVWVRGAAEAEDELKCATLLAFLQNTHWQEQAAAGAPLTIGVVGRVALFRWLRTATDGKSVEGHPLRVIQLEPAGDPACCQVLYFATGKLAEIKPMLQSASAARALTIGEGDAFLDQGGAVNLFLVDGHMAFEVSLAALNRAGIEISSKLLRFGQIRDLAKPKVAR